MYFKRYVFLSMVFLVVVGAFVHVLIPDDVFTLSLFGFGVPLPISLWVVLPALILLLSSLLHFGFYYSIRLIKNKRREKDLKKCELMAKNALLQIPQNAKVKDENLQIIDALLTNSKLYINHNFRFNKEKLDEIITMIESINSGKYTNISDLKLNSNNPYYIQNEINHIKEDVKYAEKILFSNEDEKLKKEAFKSASNFLDKKKLLKANIKKDKEIVFNLIKRLKSKENPIELSKDEIVEFCKEAEFDKYDFIKAINILQNNLTPDEVIEIAYYLQSKIEEANWCYLYINLEFEKMEEAKNYLEQFEESDLKEFRYYIALREIGFKPNLKEFLKVE